MSFSKGLHAVTLEELLSKVSESSIAAYYLGIYKIPCFISSPFRKDVHPSFGIFSTDGIHVKYKDMATRESGGLFDLLQKMWGLTFVPTLQKIYKDMVEKEGVINDINIKISEEGGYINQNKERCDIKVKFRDWQSYDIEYWESYGISIKWLKYANVRPISHKFITKGDKIYTFGASKYAYAYIENKDNNITYKIYQPFNKEFKWSSNIDKSIWSLWTKIPKYGDILIISSSLKDSLNIWANTRIPSICMQGEGYLPKPKVMEELKNRFKHIIVFFDNDFSNEDNPGRQDSLNLLKEYPFLKRVEIPAEYKAKDPSDLFKKYGKEKYLVIINNLIASALNDPINE